MGWRAYPDLSFLSASLLHLSFITCALSLSSSHFICHLSPNSSVSPPLIHGLRHHVSFSLCSFFSFCPDKAQWMRNTALETWQSKRYLSRPCRARWRGLQILYLLGCKHIYQGMNYHLVAHVSAKTCLSRCPSSKALSSNKNHLWRGASIPAHTQTVYSVINVLRTRKKKKHRVPFLWTQLININASVLEQQSMILNTVFSTPVAFNHIRTVFIFSAVIKMLNTIAFLHY